MTPEEIAEIRARHMRYHLPEDNEYEDCDLMLREATWPCETIRILDALEQQRDRFKNATDMQVKRDAWLSKQAASARAESAALVAALHERVPFTGQPCFVQDGEPRFHVLRQSTCATCIATDVRDIIAEAPQPQGAALLERLRRYREALRNLDLESDEPTEGARLLYCRGWEREGVQEHKPPCDWLNAQAALADAEEPT